MGKIGKRDCEHAPQFLIQQDGPVGQKNYRATDGQNIGEGEKMRRHQINITSITGLNTRGLSSEEVREVVEWKEIVNAGQIPIDWKPSWDRAGLEELVDSAKEYYEERTGLILPHNLAVHGPWVGHPNGYKLYEGDRFDSAPAEEMVSIAARFASWLKIIADQKLVGLQRLLEKNLSSRGMNSPRTKIDPYRLLRVWSSPHTAEKMFWKSYKRAWQILKPFGLAPSWKAVGQVMTNWHSYRVGKMAFIIAARTVNQILSLKVNREFTGKSIKILEKSRGIGQFVNDGDYAILAWAVDRIETGEFSCIREAIANAGRLEWDKTDGVGLWIDPSLTKEIHRVEVIHGWDRQGWFYFLLRQKGTGRSYHFRPWKHTAREAVKFAIGEWHKQVRAERKKRNILKVLQPKNASVLVWIQDSLDSGNCYIGTRAWSERNGFNGAMFAPAEKLLKFADDLRVFRVLQTVAEKVAELKLKY